MILRLPKCGLFIFLLLCIQNVLSTTLSTTVLYDNSTLLSANLKSGLLENSQATVVLKTSSELIPRNSSKVLNNTTLSPILHVTYQEKRQGLLRTGGHDESSPDVYCKFQPNGYDCDKSGIFIPKFYYDIKMQNCRTFHYGRCADNNRNEFHSVKQCHDTCFDSGKSEISGTFSTQVYCKFQPDFGSCNNYEPKWYYDVTARNCKGFSYSGCGGNLNRFDTYQICVALCNTKEEDEYK